MATDGRTDPVELSWSVYTIQMVPESDPVILEPLSEPSEPLIVATH